MLSERRIRQMYAKNREKIVHYIKNSKNGGCFTVNFYENGNVKISTEKDDEAELFFIIQKNGFIVHSYVDMEFSRTLVDYLRSLHI
jgi:hypothetical protein